MNINKYLISPTDPPIDGFLMKPWRSSVSTRFTADRRPIDAGRDGEVGDRRFFDRDEVFAVHAIRLVSAMSVEEDFGVGRESAIDDDRDAVKATEGGRRAALAVVKDEFEIVLVGEFKLVECEYFGQLDEVDPMRRGEHCEEVLISREEQNAFGDRASREVRRVGSPRRGRSGWT